MQNYEKYSQIYSQISTTFSSAATKTLSLELINNKDKMTRDEFMINLKQIALQIPFLQMVTYNELFSLLPQKNFLISQKEFEFSKNDDQKIGAGANAMVFLAMDHVNDDLIAMKIMTDADQGRSERYFQECINQYKLSKINRDLILNFVNYVFISFVNFNTTFYLPLELAEFSLFDYIQQQEINQETYNFFFNLFIDILIILHENNYAHRDIKPHNILFIKDKGWKLADFGESIKYEHRKSSYRIQGTTAFMPKAVRNQAHLNIEIIQDLFYNDIYSVVCTLVLIKNPKFNSKELIQFMENQNLDQQQQQLLQINHPDELKSIKLNTQTLNIQSFLTYDRKINRMIQYDIEFILLSLYYDIKPFLNEKLINFINNELYKFQCGDIQEYQRIIFLLLILHPFQIEQFNNLNLLKINFVQLLLNELIYKIRFQILIIFMVNMSNQQILSELVKQMIADNKLKILLGTISEMKIQYPKHDYQKLLIFIGNMILYDTNQIDSQTIIMYNQTCIGILGEDPEIFEQNPQSEIYDKNQLIDQSELEAFNFDSYVKQNKYNIQDQNTLNLVMLFKPLQYYLDHVTYNDVILHIIQQLKYASQKDVENSQKLSQIIRYHLIKGGARQYMKDIKIIIESVINIFESQDLFFDLLDLLSYFADFIILEENEVKLFTIIMIQKIQLVLNIQINMNKIVIRINPFDITNDQANFRVLSITAQLFTIYMQQDQICQNQNTQSQFDDPEQLGRCFFYMLSHAIREKVQIIYQSNQFLSILTQVVEVLRNQTFQQQKYLRMLILILNKFLFAGQFDFTNVSQKYNTQQLRQYDHILLQFYVQCKQYHGITFLVKESPKNKVFKNRQYLFNDPQQYALKVFSSLKKSIKIDNLNLREQFMSLR